MRLHSYLDLLAQLGVGSAHPGGFKLTQDVLHQLSLRQDSLVLDAGCGTGKTAVYAADTYGCAVTGMDQNPLMLQKAQKRALREGASIQLVQGDITHIPCPAHSFDVVLSESVLVFAGIAQALREFYRVLRPSGSLAVIEMTVERRLGSAEAAEIGAVYGTTEFLTEPDWIAVLHSTGFSSVRPAGGGTIAASLNQYTEQPDLDLSPQLDPSIYNAWAGHEAVIRKYQHLLGHRVFICGK